MFGVQANHIFYGRAAATMAEVGFAFQLSWVFRDRTMSIVLSIANAFCWLGVITKNQIFHVVEETLWMVMGVYLFLRYRKQMAALNVCAIYVIYMVFVDIPMYVTRWMEYGGPVLGLIEGIYDTFQCEIVSKGEVWYPEMFWMTPYFTIAVWFSIYMGVLLDEAPPKTQQKKQRKKQE